MEFKRKPTEKEINLIEFLIRKANYNISEDWKDKICVQQMNDGNMGSLKIFTDENINNNRIFYKTISELDYNDKDNVVVLISLNIDNFGDLYELDIWKTNFNKLIEFPNINY